MGQMGKLEYAWEQLSKTLTVDLLGITGMVLSFVMLVSPLPAVISGLKNREMKSLSGIYLICAMGNALLWAVYGFKLWEFSMYLTNTFAFVMFLFYYNCFLYINYQGQKILPTTIFTLLFSTLVFFLIPKEVAGFLAFFTSTFWMLTSIVKMREALAEKNAQYINLPVILTSLLCNLIWLSYGYVLRNYYIVIPNLLGFILYSCNMLTYIWTYDVLDDNNFLIRIIKNTFAVEPRTPREMTGREKERVKKVH